MPAPPFFVLIERALRDEGTSYHYLPSARYAEADPALTDAVARALAGIPTPLLRGASWTTDAPFRESASLIAGRRAEGILSVEMEAAALVAMGRALAKPVTCLAHVTNAMATRPDDFEKGGHDGQEEALEICSHRRRCLRPPQRLRKGSEAAMNEKRIYLDFNASTPLASQVIEAMRPLLTEHFGNPSTHHWAGAPAKAAVERARTQVAALLSCEPDEIVFTSGGSESNNHALKGVFFANRNRGDHIVTSAVEHPAILQPLRFLESLGAKVTVLPVDRHGRVDPEDVRKALTPRTVLVSIMHANNEVGTVQPIAEIAAIARAAGVLMHSDAAQSVGKIPTRVDELGVDLLSVAGHKLYAPKGVGALFIRRGTRIEPFVHGAGHEQGRRAGTENVLLDVALGAACEVAMRWLGMSTVRELRDRFEARLKELFGEKLTVNGAGAERLPNTANVNFVGQVGANVLARLSGVAASTGSACHAGSVELSPVLAAMRVPPREGMGAVRFSLGRTTTWEDLEHVLSMLRAVSSADRAGTSTDHAGRSLREHWDRVYGQKAEDELTWHQAHPSTSLQLISRADIGPDARIVDIGGGASRLSDALLDREFQQLTVVDIAEGALEKAKRRLGPRASKVTWIRADVSTWEPGTSFDVWHDRAVFHFMVRPEDRQAYRATMRKALRVGGQAIIGTFATDGPERCSGLPVRRYEPETLAAELESGFQLIDSVHEDHVTPTGKVQRFQFSRLVRR